MANHLMLSGNCPALVPTYLLEGVPFWSCSVTWPAGLPQPVVRPMLGPAQPRAPCSSQKLCLCPSLPCPSCQSPASDCGCGPCHTWMQGHTIGSHNVNHCGNECRAESIAGSQNVTTVDVIMSRQFVQLVRQQHVFAIIRSLHAQLKYECGLAS